MSRPSSTWALVEIAPMRLALCTGDEAELIRNQLVALQFKDEELFGRIAASGLHPCYVNPDASIARIMRKVTWQELAAHTSAETFQTAKDLLTERARIPQVEAVYDDPLGRYLVVVGSEPSSLDPGALTEIAAKLERALVLTGTKPDPLEPAQVPPDFALAFWDVESPEPDAASLAHGASAVLEILHRMTPAAVLDIMGQMGRIIDTASGPGKLTALSVLKGQSHVVLPDGRQVAIPIPDLHRTNLEPGS
jgi:hypothetical protein